MNDIWYKYRSAYMNDIWYKYPAECINDIWYKYRAAYMNDILYKYRATSLKHIWYKCRATCMNDILNRLNTIQPQKYKERTSAPSLCSYRDRENAVFQKVNETWGLSIIHSSGFP